MQHATRPRHRRRRPLTTPTIVRIADMTIDELDRASIERYGLLVQDHSPAALLAAAWEAQALNERNESEDTVRSEIAEHLVCRCPR